MLASMLIKKIVSKAEEEHPVIILDSCINNSQQQHICSACADICSENVFTEHDPRFDKCTNCNLCLTVCPTQSILPPTFLMQQIIRNIEDNKVKVYIYCHKRDNLGDINIYCLASLPWEMYVAMALSKNVVISFLQCKQCEHETKVISLFNIIKETMGKDFFNEHFSFSDNTVDHRIMSRREMFSSLKKDGRSVIKYVISNMNTYGSSDLFYRKYLLKKLTLLENNQIDCSWYVPIFNKNCWGCGLCASVCSNKAMTIVKKDNGEPCLVHEPWRCTQCGLCKQYCPENGIDGYKHLEKSALVKQKVFIDINARYCPECNKAMKPVDNGYFCYYCGHKENN